MVKWLQCDWGICDVSFQHLRVGTFDPDLAIIAGFQRAAIRRLGEDDFDVAITTTLEGLRRSFAILKVVVTEIRGCYEWFVRKREEIMQAFLYPLFFIPTNPKTFGNLSFPQIFFCFFEFFENLFSKMKRKSRILVWIFSNTVFAKTWVFLEWGKRPG